MENFVPLLFYFLMLILSEQLFLKSHRCHQGGKRVHKSGFKGFYFWTPTCKSCFVSIRSSTFLLYFSLQKQLMLYLVQFLEELSICPKRGRKDLHNVLWHGVESCEEVEFHASHSKETYGNSQFRELEDCPRFQSHLCIWILGTLTSHLYWGWNINRWRCYFHAVAEEIAHLSLFAQLLSCFKAVVFQPSLKVLCVAECLCSPWDVDLRYFSFFWEGNLAHISFFLVNVKSIIICWSTQHL